MENNKTYSMSAFWAGAFIGAGVALLLAPQTGAQLRRRLRTYANNAKEEMLEAWDEAMERGKHYIETGQETLQEAGSAIETAIERGKDYIESGKEMMKEVGKQAPRHRR